MKAGELTFSPASFPFSTVFFHHIPFPILKPLHLFFSFSSPSSIYSFSPIHFLPLASVAPRPPPFPTLRRNLSELISESRQSPAARRFLMQFLSKKSASVDNSCYILRINWISIISGVSNVWGSKPECQRHISIKTPHREGKLWRGSFFKPYSPTPV